MLYMQIQAYSYTVHFKHWLCFKRIKSGNRLTQNHKVKWTSKFKPYELKSLNNLKLLLLYFYKGTFNQY